MKNELKTAPLFADKPAYWVNGFFVVIAAVVGAGLASILLFNGLSKGPGGMGWLGLVLLMLICVGLKGLTAVEPNTVVLLEFFGKYYGTVHASGLVAVNPLMSKHRISTKVDNFANKLIKVNDLRGNPLELSAMVSWRVRDAAKAVYSVEHYADFLENQVEGILAEVASQHPYDSEVPAEHCFRKNSAEIAKKLQTLLQQRVADCGLEILDTRFNHFAYAVEIAAAMLKKQQAEAMVDARKKIVEGAHTMVSELLTKLAEDPRVTFTDDDKVKLAINLMTVLVSESGTQPVLTV